MLKDVLEYLPQITQIEIYNWLKEREDLEEKIEEIRFRINQNLTLKVGQDIVMLNTKITKDIMEETFENICEKSIYSYTKQISEGFITLKGGNRVGIAGSAVMEGEKIINLNYISSLNFRIARQIFDSSTPFLKYIIDIENDTIFNTLIAASPGAGKTTIIRDLVRKISNRNSRDKLFS